MVSVRAERTRQQILDVTERLIQERGYHGVGLETVAEAAGVSRQAVYDKFGSKGGLLRAMTERVEERLGIYRAIGAVAAAPDGLGKLTVLCDLSRVSEPGVAPFVRVVYAARLDDPTAAELWNDRMSARYMAFRHVVEQLAREKRLRSGLSITQATDMLWAIINPLHFDNLVTSRGWSIDAYREHIETMARAALLGEAPPAFGRGEAATRPPRVGQPERYSEASQRGSGVPAHSASSPTDQGATRPTPDGGPPGLWLCDELIG